MAIGKSLRFKVLKRDSYRCQICGRSAQADQTVQLEIDHKLARAKGGLDDLSNLWTLCFDCNRGKRDRFLNEEGASIEASFSLSSQEKSRRNRAESLAKAIAEGSREPHSNLFRRLREAQGYTRPELAEQCKLQLATIIALETNRPFKKDKINHSLLCEALSVGHAQLLGAIGSYNLALLTQSKAANETERLHTAFKRVLKQSRRCSKGRRVRA